VHENSFKEQFAPRNFTGIFSVAAYLLDIRMQDRLYIFQYRE